MSCVREASPPLADERARHDMKKRRFLQPLRGLRRIFRKKGRTAAASDGHVDAVGAARLPNEHLNSSGQSIESNFEPAKSHSTSHLDDDEPENAQRRNLQSTMLSVSHDSIFVSEQRSPNSGSETSIYAPVTRLGFPNSSMKAELFEAVHKRRNNISDDEGLPRSPVSNSPTTADDMFTKENMVTKSSQSTCSDGSLLSMGSSEIDEESSFYYNSRHSSKLSLYEKRVSTASSDLQHNDRSTNSWDGDAASLSHSAAKHKMAVKPKRNHGAPHKKRQIIPSNTLPTTPEVNEEHNQHRNISASNSTKEKSVADTRQSDEHLSYENHTHKTRNSTSVAPLGAYDHKQPKFCSLPPNVSPAPSFKLLNRSKSNATPPKMTTPDETRNEDERDSLKKEDGGGASFFSRFLLRRSSKKRKNVADEAESAKEESPIAEHASLPYLKEEPVSMTYVNGSSALTNAMKQHRLFRQRVEPLSLPPREWDSLPPFSSMVPVNMADAQPMNSVSVSDTVSEKSPGSQNSYEKLPCPSNEVLSGHAVVVGPPCTPSDEKPPKMYSVAESFEMVNGEQSPVTSERIEEIYTKPEVPRWNSSVLPAAVLTKSAPDYENLNRLSITVNDHAESTSLLDIVTENKKKDTQIPDVKIPVPAPRTSLMNRPCSSPSPILIEKGERSTTSSSSSTNENLSMIVNENVDGQKSIISIGSVSDFPMEFQTEIENQKLPDENLLPKNEDLEDDVFQIQTELPFVANDFQVETSPVISEIEMEMDTTEMETCDSNVKVDPEFSPSADGERITSSSNSHEDELSLTSSIPPPDVVPTTPVVVADFNAGIVKVNDTIVVIRKKSNRDSNQRKDEEPELMKVFARRSLKLRESDNLEESLYETAKSRDSDKENEDFSMSVLDDREKKRKSETSDIVIPVVPPKPVVAKFHRSVSNYEPEKSILASNNTNERRPRCKSTPNDMDRCSDEKDVSPPPLNPEEKSNTTPFKRIQQRREEWEKRAQQARVQGTR